jgi:hypothetical protein
MMPQGKVEVYPNESRGLPKRKSRSTQTLRFSGFLNVEAIFMPSLPPVGDGVRVGGIVVPMGKLPPSRLRAGPRRDSPRKAAFRADERRVGPMEDTQIWEEVK